MTDERMMILWAISFRLGQIKERRRAMNGLDADVKERSRLEGNIGALEQVQRWLTGKELMPTSDMSDRQLQDMV